MPSERDKIVAAAELLHVGLVYSHFRRNPNSDFDVEDKEKFMSQSLISKPELDRESKVLSGVIRSRIWVDPQSDDEDTSGEDSFNSANLQIETHHTVAFEVQSDADFSESALSSFVNTIGKMTVWPYFRAHCAQMGAEAFVLLPPAPLRKARYPISEEKYQDQPESA